MVERLDDVLASVGRHLVIESDTDAVDGRDPLDRSPARLGPRRGWRRPLLAAAAAVAVMAATAVALGPTRRAVGGWLRAGPIEVSIDPEAAEDQIEPASDVPDFIDRATPVAPSRIDEILGRPIPVIDGSMLGQPSEWWTVAEGGVVATWDDGSTSLWIVSTDEHQSAMITKVVGSADTVVALADLGDGGFAVTGAHVLQTPHRRVAAESVVAWSQGPVTFRLESTIDIGLLIDIARSIAGPTGEKS